LFTGLGLCIAGLPLLTLVMVDLRANARGESVLLIYLLAVVVVAVVGGIAPGLLAAVGGFLLANWFLTPPFHTFTVGEPGALTDLLVFVLAAAIVSVTVEVGARNRAKAERNRLQTLMVANLSSAEMKGVSVERVLDQVRGLYNLRTVALAPRADRQHPLVSVGPPPDGSPVLAVPASDTLTLLGYGRPAFAADRVLLRALAGTSGRAWETARLAEEAARAEQLAQTDRVRSALLTAVGHDLRTPLAGIKTAASGLRQTNMAWAPGEQEELLATIEDGADRLAALVDNLLAMSRIQAGALSVHTQPVDVEEVVSRALLGRDANRVVLDVPDGLPPVMADGGLLERVVANLVDNAVRYTPEGRQVTITAGLQPGTAPAATEIRVADLGPGADPKTWEEMFVPFQRLGDNTPGGVGLGLAIARGFTQAMGGTLRPSTTPGGGLTMTIRLPAARL
jgi:two-component system sensor histidine kinase KdpD